MNKPELAARYEAAKAELEAAERIANRVKFGSVLQYASNFREAINAEAVEGLKERLENARKVIELSEIVADLLNQNADIILAEYNAAAHRQAETERLLSQYDETKHTLAEAARYWAAGEACDNAKRYYHNNFKAIAWNIINTLTAVNGWDESQRDAATLTMQREAASWTYLPTREEWRKA